MHGSVDERVANAEGKLARRQAPYRPVNVVDPAGGRLPALAEMPIAGTDNGATLDQRIDERRRSPREPQATDGTLDGGAA